MHVVLFHLWAVERRVGGDGGDIKSQEQPGRSTVHPQKNVVPGGKHDLQISAEPVRTIGDMIRATRVVSIVFSSQIQQIPYR